MTRRKHWYSGRAWLDGWKIARYSPFHEMWLLDESPAFYNNHEYRVVPDSEGWLPVYNPQPVDIPGGHKLENKTIGGILCYRIIKEADKPKTKKVKLLAWLGTDHLYWYLESETKSLPKSWKRVPSEDKEIEVEL